MDLLLHVLALLNFTTEVFNVSSHLLILSGLRSLPRRDFLKIRRYFLVETFSVAIAAILTGKLYWLAGLHMFQHLYGIATYGQSSVARKIVDWSSLERTESSKGRLGKMVASRILPLDCFFLTLFDIFVHVCMMYGLMVEYLDPASGLVCFLASQMFLCWVVFNPKFAWSSPGQIPDWVRRRLETSFQDSA